MREKEKEENTGKIWRKMSRRFGREEERVLGERKIKLENGKRKGEYGEEDEPG